MITGGEIVAGTEEVTGGGIPGGGGAQPPWRPLELSWRLMQ